MGGSSKSELSGGVVELVVVHEETERLLELVHGLMALLSFVSGYMTICHGLGASFRLGLLCLLLGDRNLSCWTISLLLDVWLGVPVDVQAVGTVLLEEELLEVCLELRLGDGREHGDLALLAIKLVLMSGELLGPES